MFVALLGNGWRLVLELRLGRSPTIDRPALSQVVRHIDRRAVSSVSRVQREFVPPGGAAGCWPAQGNRRRAGNLRDLAALVYSLVTHQGRKQGRRPEVFLS